jgi:hypothetical protein
MPGQPAGGIHWRIAGREQHVVHARRTVGGQPQDRVAELIAEILPHLGEEPPAPVPGMPARQPPAMIGGVDRPHVPDLAPLDIRHRDQLTAGCAHRAPGLGSHHHDPVPRFPCHDARLAATALRRQAARRLTANNGPRPVRANRAR